MKKLTLSLCALVALASAAFAGTETYSKESKAVVPPPCPQWYADNEFNLSISGVYAFSGNDNTFLDHGWGGAPSTSSINTSVLACRDLFSAQIRIMISTDLAPVMMMIRMALVVSLAPSHCGSRSIARGLPRMFGSVVAESGVTVTMTSFSMLQAQLSAGTVTTTTATPWGRLVAVLKFVSPRISVGRTISAGMSSPDRTTTSGWPGLA
jgi:hypothetical protein